MLKHRLSIDRNRDGPSGPRPDATMLLSHFQPLCVLDLPSLLSRCRPWHHRSRLGELDGLGQVDEAVGDASRIGDHSRAGHSFQHNGAPREQARGVMLGENPSWFLSFLLFFFFLAFLPVLLALLLLLPFFFLSSSSSSSSPSRSPSGPSAGGSPPRLSLLPFRFPPSSPRAENRRAMVLLVHTPHHQHHHHRPHPQHGHRAHPCEAKWQLTQHVSWNYGLGWGVELGIQARPLH